VSPRVGEPVTLTVQGYFGDGCGRDISASAQVGGSRILISMFVEGPGPGGYCPMIVVPFAQAVPLAGLEAGNYVIDVEMFIHEFGRFWIQYFPGAGELFVHSGGQRYQLRPGSWFMDECPVCDSIPVKLPMKGTFELMTIGPGDVFDFYSVDYAAFEAEGYQITGGGRYQISPPNVAGLQAMWLEVAVNGEIGILVESDIVPLVNSAPFPRIDIELAERTTSISRRYRMRILAVPVNALPVADLDEDGDVDAADSAWFQSCMTGPRCGPAPVGCETADFDVDGDIDQADFGIMQRCYSGQERPADPSCAD